LKCGVTPGHAPDAAEGSRAAGGIHVSLEVAARDRGINTARRVSTALYSNNKQVDIGKQTLPSITSINK
jgi:hypothetical protein